MNTSINAVAKIVLVLIGALPLLSACNGGGDDEPAPSASAAPTSSGTSSQGKNCNVFFLLVSLGTLCVDTAGIGTSGTSPGGSSGTGNGVTSSGSGNGTSNSNGNVGDTLRARINRVAEYETNNTLDNANAVLFPAAAGDDVLGIEVSGSLSAPYDSSDFFVFTPPRSGDYLVYLCAATDCSESLVTDDVYIMLFDQSQTTIAHTDMIDRSERRFSVNMTAGLAYYAEVHALDNDGGIIDYRLVVIE
jgi:hypothetical protein